MQRENEKTNYNKYKWRRKIRTHNNKKVESRKDKQRKIHETETHTKNGKPSEEKRKRK